MTQRRILIVDDDAKFLRFVSEILIGAGYAVRGTGDPFQALSLAEEFHPELVILDLSMPGKDGLKLAEELRKMPKTAKIPCMFLTARKASEGVQAAKSIGAVAYLEKPVQSSSLLWTIKSLLGISDNTTDGSSKE